MSRKQPKRRAGNMVFSAIAGIFIIATVGGVGLGVALADSSDYVARAGSFGFDAATHKATAQAAMVETAETRASAAVYERSALASASTRTIDAGLQMIDDREEAARAREQARIDEYHRNAKEIDAAALERVRKEKAKQGISGDTYWGTDEYGLPAVDWTVGWEAFVNEWTARIDAYLAGTQLEGYGRVFAEAAWERGVDPRWSPAISNTESGNGKNCFLPCNAWGWGETGWDDWETAIRAHIKGLATVYGYSVTPNAAAVYCPPNTEWWYSNTLSQMASI